MNKKNILFSIFLCLASMASALTLNQAKQLYLNGEYAKALPTFLDNLKANPKNANLNQWVGVCLYETGKEAEAEKYLEVANSRNIAEAARYLAQIALDRLDYDKAKELIEEYEERIDNDDSKISENAKISKDRIKRTVAMLNNVEKIQIIDSLVVDKADFFKHYKIAPEAGSLNSTDVLPYNKPQDSTAVFIPESHSRMMWAMTDSTGIMRLAETYKLNNDKWEKYSFLPENLNDNGNANYPFMMADGITLYYASNGDGSIGGYDIFMSRKDLDTGEYLNPQNIGMPYNSPADDYLLAIDEMTGAGWWATDRNKIPEKVTIYVFIPNDIRQNYSADDENITSFAAVKSIRDTWEPEADYSSLLDEIASIDNDMKVADNDFIFHLKNGVTYTKFSDFNSSEARSLMQKRIEIEKFLDKISLQLSDLRAKFHQAKVGMRPKISTEITTLENTILKNNAELEKIDNNIRAAEIPTLKTNR